MKIVFLMIAHGVILSLLVLTNFACTAKFLKYDKSDDLKNNQEFNSKVAIEENSTTVGTKGDSVVVEDEKPAAPLAFETKTKKGKKVAATVKSKTRGKRGQKTVAVTPPPKTIDLKSRPFWIGEKVVHQVRYFKMLAGTLTMETDPLVKVNHRMNYRFHYGIETNGIFSAFYSVDDHIRAMADVETLLPSVLTLELKETGQLKEARALFDPEKKTADYWEKKVTKKDGVEEKKKSWELDPTAQNVFTGIYFLRTFDWKVGDENKFIVSEDGDNLTFTGKAIREETLKTDAGTFETIVIKPKVELKGVFKPIGDVFVWLSKDPHHYLLRIECAIKIGTLVSQAVEIVPGGGGGTP